MFKKLEEPKAKIEPKISSHHEIINKDDYAWLKAENWQEVLQHPACLDETIRAYLEAENSYQAKFMEDSTGAQEALFDELKARIKEDDSSVPLKDGPFAYGTRYNIGAGLPDFFRIDLKTNSETTYLAGDKVKKAHSSDDKAYFQIGSVKHAPDHQKFLFSYDDKGSESYYIKICNFEGSSYPEILENTSSNIVWNAEATGFYYIRLTNEHRPLEVYYHELGQKQDKDRLIYKELDTGYYLSLSASADKKYIFISVHNHETSEIWLLDKENLHCIKKRQTKLEYFVESGDDEFYILTNKDEACDFKIMQSTKEQLLAGAWQEYIPHKPGRLIHSVLLLKHHLVWLESENGLANIKYCLRKDRNNIHKISLEEAIYDLDIGKIYEYDTNEIRFTYSSPSTPLEQYSYNLDSGERHLLKKQIVPSGHDKEQYITRRIMAPTSDGELVPISLYYHKETPIDGTAPCLLYGYGAYGISIPASFNTNSLSLVNRGFIYAIAHIRGGKEKGTHWYEEGKYQQKTNSFNDFISAARYLVQQNYTSHQKLIAYGGSAGGMLMGAIANRAPDDFFSIIAAVPFVDVLNTMLDDTLPLTPPEWPEWGNPIKNKEDYKLIASYSPYDNIKAQEYPYILALAGLTDPRVTYWEAAKWVAKLRATKTDCKPLLLRLDMDSGHAGSADRFAKLKENAYIYAYIFKLLNIKL